MSANKNILFDTGKNITLNPEEPFFADASYHLDVEVCSKPTCDCGGVSLFIKEGDTFESATIKYKVKVNVFDTLVNSIYDDEDFTSEKRDEFFHFYYDNLTDYDWKVLKSIYRVKKFNLVEGVNPDKVYFEFTKKDYREVSMMYQYGKIFPNGDFYVNYQDTWYLLLDNYCKNPECECNDMYFHIFEMDASRRPEDTSVGVYFYNYQTKDVKIDEGNKELMKEIVAELFTIHPEADQIFERRSNNLKIIYELAKFRYEKENRLLKTHVNKVGRNEPCPCGSGKKYKRCCLKK